MEEDCGLFFVQGEMEENYDYIIITTEQDVEKRFTGSIKKQFMVQGSSLTIQLLSDGSITKSGVTIHIEKNR